MEHTKTLSSIRDLADALKRRGIETQSTALRSSGHFALDVRDEAGRTARLIVSARLTAEANQIKCDA